MSFPISSIFQGSYGIVKLAYNEQDDVHYVSTGTLYTAKMYCLVV